MGMGTGLNGREADGAFLGDGIVFCILTRVWVTQESTFMEYLRPVHFMANFTLGRNKRTLVSDTHA